MREIYSCSLIYWKSSNALSSFPSPDARFIDDLARAGLQGGFANPWLSTVATCVAFLGIRPAMSVINNPMSVGRVVALANCLGLNGGPTT